MPQNPRTGYVPSFHSDAIRPTYLWKHIKNKHRPGMSFYSVSSKVVSVMN